MNNFKIQSSISKKIFEKFLLNLSSETLEQFTHFGKINKKNVTDIINLELSNVSLIKFFTIVNNELIAYSFLKKFEKRTKKHNCILGIIIDDKWQNKKLGSKICKHMIETAWNKNFEKIWLTVYSDNKHALYLYKNLGFEMEGIFLYDEKLSGKFKHKISMALFSNGSHRLEREQLQKKIK